MTDNKPHEGETAREAGARVFKERIPVLLKTHKKDVLDILTAVNGKPAEKMSVMDIISESVELFNDQEFVDLFLSASKKAAVSQPIESSAHADHSEPE